MNNPDFPYFRHPLKTEHHLAMSVIQTIRDKYARVSVIAIGLALLGFILMDAFTGRSGLFGDDRETTLGKINGKKIEFEPFNKKVSEIALRQGQQAQTEQIVNYLWEQEVEDKVMSQHYEDLGITITDKEFDQLLFGPNPPQEFKQAFSNPQDPNQQWNAGEVRQRFREIEKSGAPDQKAGLADLVTSLKKQALMSKFNALIINSIYVPKWFLEKRNIDNSQMAKASYVGVPYTTINDSTVKVSDKEIEEYVNAHKKDFESKEESRTISYVQFSAEPSAADSAAIRNTMLAVKDSFTATKDVKNFLVDNKSQAQYMDNWVAANDLNLLNKDSIFKAPIGVASGPFAEKGFFVMTKIIDKKTQPDTAKVRHILIATATQDPQTGQFIPTKDTVLAKKTADSIKAAIANGASFDSLLVKLSDDPSKAINNGVFDSITRSSGLVQGFKDFALDKPVGSKDVVKTEFGYHYMEVLNQRGSSPVYKVAFFVLPLEVSRETDDNARNEATSFVSNATDEKSFNDYFEKNLKSKGRTKMSPPNPLHPLDFTVAGINGPARDLVKDVFKAKKGDVLEVKYIAPNYIVAMVTDVQEPGVPSAKAARPLVEPMLVNKKKADLLKSQMGTITDLNAVATKFNQQVQNADSIRFEGGNALGYEFKVLGALFNPANKGKVCPEAIAGTTGVYAIRVDNTFTGAVNNANIDEQRNMMEMQSRRQYQSPLEIYKKKADIKDYRAKFF